VVDSNLRFLSGGGDTDRSLAGGSALGAEPRVIVSDKGEVKVQRARGYLESLERTVPSSCKI